MPEPMGLDYKIRFGSEWYANVYLLDGNCFNCGQEVQILIRHGVLKPTEPMECTCCHCKTLRVY